MEKGRSEWEPEVNATEAMYFFLPNCMIPSLDPPGKKFHILIWLRLLRLMCGSPRRNNLCVPWRVPPYPGALGVTSYFGPVCNDFEA